MSNDDGLAAQLRRQSEEVDARLALAARRAMTIGEPNTFVGVKIAEELIAALDANVEVRQSAGVQGRYGRWTRSDEIRLLLQRGVASGE